jgi:hypothetical protein
VQVIELFKVGRAKVRFGTLHTCGAYRLILFKYFCQKIGEKMAFLTQNKAEL